MASPELRTFPLGFPWQTAEPFLFCVHHHDRYPAGDEGMAPVGSLAGRQLGSDFSGKDGWSMYHGRSVPGFPRHPHRGFETVTIVRQGLIDHSDSMGATARFGAGDVQWITTGRGLEHSEMFPLVNRDTPNPTELFQIWLNLPRRSKMDAPYFSMTWRDQLPVHHIGDAGARTTVVTVAGALEGHAAPAVPPSSWAADAESHLAIWTIRMDAGARWTVPAADASAQRRLYFFAGDACTVAGQPLDRHVGIVAPAEQALEIVATGNEAVEFLMLQARPIGEPIAQHGPFVMNSQGEIRQAFEDFQAGRFGRWPWGDGAPVHARERGRFAVFGDGRVEEPEAG